MTTWTDNRDVWVRSTTHRELCRVIAVVASGYETDENLGDTTERIETVLWLATRGELGKEWGHAGAVVEDS